MLGWSRPDSLPRRAWWHLLHFICQMLFVPTCRYRAWGVRNVPQKGPVLLLSNHQSYFDPIFVGMAFNERTVFAMARSTLFRNPLFGWLIRSLNAIAVERGESDLRAMRRALDVLNDGHALLLFPEGTRTVDGKVGPFATGTMLLIKRARPTVVPVAIEGAYRIWPKGQMAPRLGEHVSVAFGEAISAETLIEMGAEAALGHLRQRVEEMRHDLAARRRRA